MFLSVLVSFMTQAAVISEEEVSIEKYLHQIDYHVYLPIEMVLN